MRIFAVTSELPYPPNHGASVDILNRYDLLKAAGCPAMLATWAHEPLTKAEHRALLQVFEAVEVTVLRRGWREAATRLRHLPRHSHFVSGRFPSEAALQGIVDRVRGFGAEAVVLEEPYGAALATGVADRLGLPLFYRSHNVEFTYMRSQARAARGLARRLSLTLGALHLERLEMEILRKARASFDISEQDAAYWRGRGLARIHWLPSLFRTVPAGSIPWGDRAYDLVFLGNLNTPNNVAGLRWFVEQVLPDLLRRRPSIRICVAGSRPSGEITALFAGRAETRLLADPPDAGAVWRSGRVLFNPVQTGSGVNVKSAEMLFYDSPLVSTGAGVRGLPPWIQANFQVTDSPAEFARAIDEALARGPASVTPARRQAREALGPAGIEVMVTAMREATARPPREGDSPAGGDLSQAPSLSGRA